MVNNRRIGIRCVVVSLKTTFVTVAGFVRRYKFSSCLAKSSSSMMSFEILLRTELDDVVDLERLIAGVVMEVRVIRWVGEDG